MEEFKTWFLVGFDHILNTQALDHILFILALVVIYDFKMLKNIIILVTAFTIGHSITLALSALELITYDQKLIEFAIPLTILITAFNNIINRNKKDVTVVNSNYAIALVFGLIHGLGFANYLKAILFKGSIVFELFAFNVGIEKITKTEDVQDECRSCCLRFCWRCRFAEPRAWLFCLAILVPADGLCRAEHAPGCVHGLLPGRHRVQETGRKTRLRFRVTPSGPSRARFCCSKIGFRRPLGPQETPKTPKKLPKRPPRCPQEAPRGPQERPRAAKNNKTHMCFNDIIDV